MSDSSIPILDQLAGIKQLLQERSEDCAQQLTYEQERRDIADKQRAEIDAIGSLVRENLNKILNTQVESISQEKAAESPDDGSIATLLELIRENHNNRMSAIQEFIQGSIVLQHQQRTKLLEELSRIRKSRRAA
ncbi:hypothetical protein B0H11DRAFT_2220660 [Mycena galericulata]|nr:hypothetical protein B0H11DRAFT_2220660 [Mycena galericulata]